jgi:hypothetical protein
MRIQIGLLLSIASIAGLGWALSPQPQQPQQGPVGYTDTPQLPDSKWRVHDKNRPVPRVVTPGKLTVSNPAPAPSDAVILFDGKDLSSWTGGSWLIADGAMTVNGSGGIKTKQSFGDVQLHLEWRAPDEPKASSQGKGNSGVFFMGRYEIQVLNSYQNRTYADGQAASLYGQKPPLVNACRPTGEWQTYDIVFLAPRFDDGGQVTQPARVTVFHNGILVQHDQKLLGPTAHKSLPKYSAHAAKLPISLQDHGNPVSYRNIWTREL